ncbi:UDP-N-acetylglucosamine 1-carboxyvinyltransferase [Iodidimonas nitroreducens]|uniref:UDP-N-acetylglucosamine 1-carboxyvinyltransferase n=1 Tax=Iodidimonas nitroreducens TaxID=1236968 RepID=A0A5A7NAR5_9PROT|nr:UDP-N-acetylglucosamine 1-carboxyvinyltransferase [Iodidimonas nitroreducens]GAK33286.1 UDP-N-acetylglucosamine 1-carboxyvinyltransferase [alpha proteobacterium Q-1]GER04129.1 UDP-N-acetylglucosamine 1-carboxyvinyltransferase [Iodidimonas nitroreducens]
MDKLIIRGGRALSGTVRVSGAKNAALPLMAACLLIDEPLRLSNLPRLADIATMGDLLNHHGASITLEGAVGAEALDGQPSGRSLLLTARRIADSTAPYDIVRKMRASILVLGPILAREGQARVSLPGGCAIGTRPIDLHLKGLKALGADVDLSAGYVTARAPKGGLIGNRVVFPKVSVGATENLMMAACLARGETLLENAAREPEVVDLGRCLQAMGARIEGLGTDRIEIAGQTTLNGADHLCMADRIEAGSYAVAAAITGGDVMLAGADPAAMEAVITMLREAGVGIEVKADGLRVFRDGPLQPITLVTQPYPGFPTDMQAQMMALMCVASGASVITEAIFENRFMHVQELARMGADITANGATATVRGVERLTGAPVMATDLRASMGLALAGLAAKGVTEVHRLYHLDRGYERIEEKLLALGADVERVAA